MRRQAAMLLCVLALAACGQPPRPFEHDDSEAPVRRLPQDKIELAIAPPKYMLPEMANRVAAALAMELQSYGIVATVQPAAAPIQVSGTMSTRDAASGIEIQIDWRIDGAPKSQEPAISKTRARPEDYAEASERLVSRIAQQAAPRVAPLIGTAPTYQARSPGQVAAGMSVPEEPTPDAATAMASANVPGSAPTPPAQQQQQVKVMVAEVTGAPSDGNRQLYSGMRRALGSSKIVIVDAAGPDVFIVVGTVNLPPMAEPKVQQPRQWRVEGP